MTLTVTPDPVLPEILHIVPMRYPDARGWFSETFNEAAYRAAGIQVSFLQDNQSYSAKAGTLRGLHFQRPPHAQAKLVRCIRGRVLDVAVDLRKGSPRFGKYTAREISAENGVQVFVPVGFGHGFCTLEPECELSYKVSAGYAPGSDAGVAFNDPDIAVRWPFPEVEMILSDKDLRLPPLAKLGVVFTLDAVG